MKKQCPRLWRNLHRPASPTPYKRRQDFSLKCWQLHKPENQNPNEKHRSQSLYGLNTENVFYLLSSFSYHYKLGQSCLRARHEDTEAKLLILSTSRPGRCTPGKRIPWPIEREAESVSQHVRTFRRGEYLLLLSVIETVTYSS
jgi:hypothetical protein